MIRKKPIPITQHNSDYDTTQTVSIGCVTYNHERFIRNTIEGFLMQKTNFPVKIVIFEDCSTDKTASLIKEYQSKYPHLFKVFYQPENTYKKAIRQKAFEPYYEIHNESKYIALCEGDDYWIDPLKLQKQVDFLEQNEDYGLIYTNINKVDEYNFLIEENTFTTKPFPRCESFEDYLTHAPFLAPCTWVIRKELIKRQQKPYVVGDLPLLLGIASHSKIYRLEDTTANYRILKRSASHFTTIKQEYTFMKGIYEIQLDYAEKYSIGKDVIETIKENFALRSFNFAVAQNDKYQIKDANKLLNNHPKLTSKFKIVQFISKFKLGRVLYGKIFNKRLGN